MREKNVANKAGISCRSAEESDIAFISGLEAESFAQPWSGNMILGSFRSDYDKILIAELSGIPAGYIIYSAPCEDADLLRVAVNPHCRRAGVGGALLDAMTEDCALRGVENIFLEVRASNVPATALYERDGYERISVRKGYYSNPGEDGIVMRKQM